MNKEKFQAVYIECLRESVQQFPTEYGWPVEQVPQVAARMFAAIERGSASFDSRTFRAAAKRLGIKPTAKAIRAFYFS